MEFFNKKEEVIEVVLTQKGRELYSQGNFKPVYYSFHDTDITYDDGSDEEQNNTVPRIKDTPTLKSIVDVKQPLPGINTKDTNQKQFILKNEIGSKTLGDQYAPAWNIKFLKTPPFQWYGTSRDNISDNKNYQLTFSSSIDYDKSSQELIPQFNIQTLYQVCDVNDMSKNKFSIKFPKQNFSKEFLRVSLVSIIGIKSAGIAFPFLKTKEINFLGLKIKVYEIYNKFLNKNLTYLVDTFDSEFDNFYNSSMLTLAKFFNETFPLQLETVDELVDILIMGFETDYIYSFEEIKKIAKQIENLSSIFDSFKVNDVNGTYVEFYDGLDNPFKMFTPKYNILKSMWLVKDPKFLANFEELNAYETNEDSKYELNYYYVSKNNQLYKVLNTSEIREYISLSFDIVADLQEFTGTKNIYNINIADDSTC